MCQLSIYGVWANSPSNMCSVTMDRTPLSIFPSQWAQWVTFSVEGVGGTLKEEGPLLWGCTVGQSDSAASTWGAQNTRCFRDLGVLAWPGDNQPPLKPPEHRHTCSRSPACTGISTPSARTHWPGLPRPCLPSFHVCPPSGRLPQPQGNT